MQKLARFSLLLVLVVVVLSAYLRLHESGIGCHDWPSCYGRIGPPSAPTVANMAQTAYQRIVEQSTAPLAWTTPLHRLVASLLGLAVVFLNVLALRRKRHRLNAIALLLLTIFLAVLGLRSGSLHHPGVVMGNLAGGFGMLGLLGWLVFRLGPGAPRYTQTRVRSVRPLALAALITLVFQILLGGLTSANFAATACPTLPDCHGGWFPDATIYSAFKLSEPHEISASGTAVGGVERIAIHRAHRIGAVLVTVFVLSAALQAFFGVSATRRAAVFVLAALAVELAAGIAATLTGLPIALAVGHNLLAALMLLGLLKLLAVSEYRPPVQP